jgi:putative cardiolipin synthase
VLRFCRSFTATINSGLIPILAFSLSLASLRAQADTVRPITSGPQALTLLAQKLSSAEYSIDMMAYIFAPCDVSGKLLTRILVERAKAGVKIRLLIDANNSTTAERAAFTEFMRTKAVTIKYFNSATSKIEFTSNNRIHAKFTVIDRKLYFIGGRNIQDPYFGLNSTLNFVDRDALVEGASAQEASDGFEILWQSSLTFRPSAPTAGALKAFNDSCLSQKPLDQAASSFVNARMNSAWATGYACRDVSFYVDDPAFANGGMPDYQNETSQQEYLSGERWMKKHTSRHVLETLATAKQSVLIENWLYIPLWRVKTTLDELRAHNVKITIYSNFQSDAGPSADYLAHRAQVENSVGSMHINLISGKSGLSDAWDLTPKGPSAFWRIHSKMAVIDGSHSIIGSYNMDPRSYHTNVESAMIALNCPDLAKALLADAKYMEDLSRFDPCENTPASCPLEISAFDKSLANLMDLF